MLRTNMIIKLFACSRYMGAKSAWILITARKVNILDMLDSIPPVLKAALTQHTHVHNPPVHSFFP